MKKNDGDAANAQKAGTQEESVRDGKGSKSKEQEGSGMGDAALAQQVLEEETNKKKQPGLVSTIAVPR